MPALRQELSSGDFPMTAQKPLQDMFDEAVDRWHKEDVNIPIHEWLGLTEENYALVVESPELLESIWVNNETRNK